MATALPGIDDRGPDRARGSRCRPTSRAAQLRDPATARSNRILRTCVHCGFCTATCPTYQVLGDELDSPARAHLPDQGHAGDRAAGGRQDRQAHRPLPELPRLHDHLSVGRALHAPGRPRPRVHRAHLPPAAVRARRCAGRWRGCCRTRGGSGWRSRRRALGRPLARADAAAGCGRCSSSRRARCRRRAGGRAAGVPGRGRAAQAGGAADRLRPAGARPRHQRRDDPAADAARLRGGGRRGRRLLRGADPPHGQDRAQPRVGGAEHPGLDARGAGAGSTRS